MQVFCRFHFPTCIEDYFTNAKTAVFEDKELSDRSVAAVEKQIHYGGDEDSSKDASTIQLEERVQTNTLV